MSRPYQIFGTKQRAAQSYATTYLKQQCIFPLTTPTTSAGKICVAGATGVVAPYTAGYVCLALNYKNGAGERNLSRDILDLFAQQGTIQSTPIMTNFGGGYHAGDVLTVVASDADGTVVNGARITVNTVQAVTGKILSYSLTTNAPGYPTNSICGVTGGTGSGAQFQVLSDLMQHKKGWWYSAYNPYLNTDGYALDRITTDPAGRSGDLRVDSDAALLAWAMADYDALTAGTRYQTVVQKALAWLNRLQQSHFAANGSKLVSNLVYQNTDDTTALAADCAEVLLCATRALDAYGAALVDSDGNSVKTFANALYASLTDTDPAGAWGGTAYPLYQTSYPASQNNAPPFAFNYVEPISYTQALCARANYTFANSGYLTATNKSTQAELALDYTWTRMAGQFGGQLYTPYDAGNTAQTDQVEHLAYTAILSKAMQVVNATKYARPIAMMQTAMQRMARSSGMAWGQTHQDGSLWRAKLSGVNVEPEVEAYGFVVIDVADALLAGA